MRRLFRPLYAAATYRGWMHAFIASLVSVPIVLIAMTVLALWAIGASIPVLAVAAFAGIVAFAGIAALGLLKTTRRSSVRLANRLLDTGLPEPVVERRFATAAWMMIWTAGGTALMVASLLWLVPLGVFVVWLDGGEVITIGGDVYIPGDRTGAVTIPIAVGTLVALVYLSAAFATLMRRLAMPLLGPGMGERLAAAEAEADRVASRNRLARDLHDSVGHTLTTSTIQAAVAKQLLNSDPDAARRALESIEDSSRAALDDLDRALGVLREETASTRATPTLADLGPLRDRVERAGAELAVEVEGDLSLATPAVSQEVYRIVQEGVTNALKHAPGSAMRLRIEVGDGQLRLRLANPITADSGEAADGRGLTGIKERVRLLGGRASAGPAGESDWTLHAELPLRAEHPVA